MLSTALDLYRITEGHVSFKSQSLCSDRDPYLEAPRQTVDLIIRHLRRSTCCENIDPNYDRSPLVLCTDDLRI